MLTQSSGNFLWFGTKERHVDGWSWDTHLTQLQFYYCVYRVGHLPIHAVAQSLGGVGRIQGPTLANRSLPAARRRTGLRVLAWPSCGLVAAQEQ